jgi:tRNA G18 (ribose-2'-O)-methylase SpoU
VASEANPRYKSWLRLLDGRGVKREGRTLMSGRKIVGEMLAQEPGRVLGALVRRESELDGLELPDGLPIFLLRPEIFPRLDLFGVGPPLLLAEAPSLPVWDPAAPFEGVRLFVPFQDPANVGAVLRTAAALGAETVLLKEAANPFHPKALRVSGPAAYLAGLRRGPALAELSAAENFFALSPVGRDIRSFKPPPALNLALGLEGPGLDRLWPPERRLAVPMKPGVESLNAAAAAAVALALVLLRRPAEPAAPRRPSPKPSRRRGSPRLEPR